MQEPPLVSFSTVSRVFERPVAAAPNCSERERAGIELQLAIHRESRRPRRSRRFPTGRCSAGRSRRRRAPGSRARRRGRARPRACTLMSGRPLLFMSTRPTWLPPMPDTTQVSLPPESRSARERVGVEIEMQPVGRLPAAVPAELRRVDDAVLGDGRDLRHELGDRHAVDPVIRDADVAPAVRARPARRGSSPRRSRTGGSPRSARRGA